MREKIIERLYGEMWEKSYYGTEDVTIRMEITQEEFEELSSEDVPFFYDYENGILTVSACENDLINA